MFLFLCVSLLCLSSSVSLCVPLSVYVGLLVLILLILYSTSFFTLCLFSLFPYSPSIPLSFSLFLLFSLFLSLPFYLFILISLSLSLSLFLGLSLPSFLSLTPSYPPAISVSESYSFVLTNIAGKRRFGYCRRLLVSLKYTVKHRIYAGMSVYKLIHSLLV